MNTKFPDMLKDLPLLEDKEEYISYDIDSLFTNILVKVNSATKLFSQ